MTAPARCNAPGAVTSDAGGAVRVTLDVFSGQPNPSWELSAEEQHELARRLTQLPVAAPAAREGLGYRGFVVTNSHGLAGVPAEVRVYDGVVTAPGAAPARDVHRLEEWLAAQARARGFGDLLAGD